MEGVSGIVSGKQADGPDGEEYTRGEKLMTEDVYAAIEGALAGGATEILVNDAHGPKVQSDVNGELGDVIAGKLPGRTSAEDIAVFDGTETFLQDVAVAIVVYQRALSQGAGSILHLNE